MRIIFKVISPFLVFLSLYLCSAASFAKESTEFKLSGNFLWEPEQHKTFGERAFFTTVISSDGSRFLIFDGRIKKTKKQYDEYYAVLTIFNTESSIHPINSTVISLDPHQGITPLHRIDIRFSSDNTAIAFAQDANNTNFVWRYEASNKIEESCATYMGSRLTAVSETGKYFSVETTEGLTFTCQAGSTDTTNNELFYDDEEGAGAHQESPQLNELREMGIHHPSVEGFSGDKVLVTYLSDSTDNKLEDALEKFSQKYPFVELMPITHSEKMDFLGFINEQNAKGKKISQIKIDLAYTKSIDYKDYDEFYQKGEVIFEDIGCSVIGKNIVLERHDSQHEVTIRGGFMNLSEDKSTLISCENYRMYLYKKR